MKYSLQRISVGNIEDIPEIALAGTVEIAEMQPEIQILGRAKFKQKFMQGNRIKVTTAQKNEDIPFKYSGTIATIDEFLERIDDYLLSRAQYLAKVRDLHEGGIILGHSICGILYALV